MNGWLLDMGDGRSGQRLWRWILAAGSVAVLFLLATLALACGGGGEGASREISITAGERPDGRMYFDPQQVTVSAREQVTFVVKNVGKQDHEFESDEARIEEILVPAGKTRRATWMAPQSGTFPIYCDLPGHREAGMEMTMAIGAAAPAAKQKLVIAIQPTLASTEMLEKAKPLEKFLEDRLAGVDVEIYVPLSQAGVVEALRFGQAHVAFMGAWPAALAVQLAGSELALAEVREVIIDDKKTEETFYYSYWVVPKASSYNSLAELRGKSACFPSAVSGSGYVGPMVRLIELSYLPKPEKGEADPKKFFGEVVFGGGYAQCWEALKSGQVDVTVIAGDVSEKLYNEVLSNTRSLEKQGPLPSHGVVLSKTLQEPLRSQVVTAIQGLSDPQYRDLMRGFISGIFVGFKPTDAQSHLRTFQAYLEQSGLAFTERVGR